MPLKSEELVVGEDRFQTQQYPAMHSLELLAKLMKTVGPALAALQGASMDMDLTSLGPVLSGALGSLQPRDAAQLCVDILAGTTATTGGKVIQLNTREHIDFVFGGKLKVMFQVLAHAVKVNFADFGEGSDPGAPLAPTLGS